MECPKCGYAMGPFDVECERCKRMGKPEAKPADAPKPTPRLVAPNPVTRRDVPVAPAASTSGVNVAIGLVVGIALLLGLVLCSYHVVSTEDGTQIVRKIEFTPRETFVSLTEITTMPYVTAREKHPLAVRALQREHMIESDDEFRQRLDDEADRAAKEAQDRFMREWSRSQ